LINNSASFMFSIKSINVEKLRPEAVMPEFANAVLKERGLASPIGKVTAMEESAYQAR
jgi:NitT/TauT family transport system substrate-binding protein